MIYWPKHRIKKRDWLLKSISKCKIWKGRWSNNTYTFIFGTDDFDTITCVSGESVNYGGAYDYTKLNEVYKYLFGNDTELPKIYVARTLNFYAFSVYYQSYILLFKFDGGPTYTHQYYNVSIINEVNGNLEINIKFIEFDYKTDDEKIIYESKSGKKYEYTEE